MITKEYNTEKTCLFCASEFHLEMILLPYIKTRIDNSKFVIFTDTNLDESLKLLLARVNLEEKTKEAITKINWNINDSEKFRILNEYIKNNETINVIINGNQSYIKNIHSQLDNNKIHNIQIIDCFHVSDPHVDIEEISNNYKNILNTQKI